MGKKKIKMTECEIDNVEEEEEVAKSLSKLIKTTRHEGFNEGLVVGCAFIMRRLHENGIEIPSLNYIKYIDMIDRTSTCKTCSFWSLDNEDVCTGYCRFLDVFTKNDFECRYGITKVKEDE